jgi:hypothetical protein
MHLTEELRRKIAVVEDLLTELSEATLVEIYKIREDYAEPLELTKFKLYNTSVADGVLKIWLKTN